MRLLCNGEPQPNLFFESMPRDNAPRERGG
jgi:hypothetical protein